MDGDHHAETVGLGSVLGRTKITEGNILKSYNYFIMLRPFGGLERYFFAGKWAFYCGMGSGHPNILN